MSQWYLAYDGKTLGPLDHAQAVAQASANPNGLAWREGFQEWMPIARVSELSRKTGAAVPPPPNIRTSDDIDFKLVGQEMQYVEVELDPGESAIAEAGAMMYKDPSISMESVFGGAGGTKGGFMDKLVGAGKRLITGESMFVTVFTHTGTGKAHVAFAAPYPGNIIPITLKNVNGCLICQKDSFLAAAKGVSIGIFFQRKILTGLFGGEGFIMQKLEGSGLVFVHAGGTITERVLKPGQTLHVDTGCIVAFEPTVQFDLEQAGNIKTLMFGGEGFFFARLRGPGQVWIQSLPFSRLAGRMVSSFARGREQGSALGPLADIIGGDRGF